MTNYTKNTKHAGKAKTVLIVEDDQDVRDGLGLRLGVEFNTLFAMDGVSALSQARAHHPDVIVLDLGLPAGDGMKVLGWLRDNPDLSSIPTLVLTGRDGKNVEQSAMDLGAAAFFRKPADEQDLLAEIRRLANLPIRVRKRVLIVEDDADTLAGLMLRLRSHDYEVISARDGTTALMVANKNKPDLILLDLGLPAGDGFAVLERCRQIESLSTTPVIVLSGRDSQASMDRAFAAGAAMFLQKPANDLQLLEAIEAVL